MMLTNERTTLKEARIFSFVLVSQVGGNLRRAEEILSEMLNNDWTIAAAGGAGGDPGEPLYPWANGFVILVRERDISQNGHHPNGVPDDEEWAAR